VFRSLRRRPCEGGSKAALQGSRPFEQAGLRQSERLSLDWPTIYASVSTVWKRDWDELVSNRGSGALPAAWYLGRNFAGMSLLELGAAAGGVAYPAVSTAISGSRSV
jgi:hypothetical protein